MSEKDKSQLANRNITCFKSAYNDEVFNALMEVVCMNWLSICKAQ